MRRLAVLLLSTLLPGVPQPSPAAPSAAPVAIIYGLSGEVFRTDPGQPRRAAHLLDRLPARATLEAGPGSRFAIAFATGKRWMVGSGAKVVLGATDLAKRSGDVHLLSSTPPLPLLKPISETENPGLNPGAVTIRGERITGLYPRGDAKALAKATFLRFHPLGGTGKYRVEIQDRQGTAIFSVETTEPPVKVPAETLRPGTSYHWIVSTVDRTGPAGKGEADFTTLDAGSARRREALRRAAKDPETLTLLAGIDRQLGLFAEARDELAAALKADPGNPALSEALAAMERDLADEPPPSGEGLIGLTRAPSSLPSGVQFWNGGRRKAFQKWNPRVPPTVRRIFPTN